MDYWICDDNDKPLDAKVTIENSSFVLHSRGGSRRSGNALNTDYAVALRKILSRLKDSSVRLKGVWVDSTVAKKLPEHERQIVSSTDLVLSEQDLFKVMSKRMQAVGRPVGSPKAQGNSNKRIRFVVDTATEQELKIILGASSKSAGVHVASRLDAAAHTLTKGIFQTLAVSDGRSVERVMKIKDTDMSEAEMKSHISELLILQNGCCALSGLEYQLPDDCTDPDLKASPDRIDSNLGYVKGNIQIVCWFINRWKSDDSNASFQRLLSMIRSSSHWPGLC